MQESTDTQFIHLSCYLFWRVHAVYLKVRDSRGGWKELVAMRGPAPWM